MALHPPPLIGPEPPGYFTLPAIDPSRACRILDGGPVPEGSVDRPPYDGLAMVDAHERSSELAASLAALLAQLHPPPVLSAVVDSEGRLCGASGDWSAMLGWAEDELDGVDILTLTHPADVEAARHLLATVRAGGAAHSVELRVRHRRGGHRALSWHGAGHLDGMYGALLGRRVHLDEHRFEQLVAESQEGIATVALDGTIRYANARLGELLGVPADQLIGSSSFAFVDATPEVTRQRWFAPLLRGETAVVRGTLRLRRPGMEPLWAQASARAVRDGHAQLEAIDVVVVDVDRLTRRRHQLELSSAHLDKAQRLARIGHWFADLTTGELVWSPMIYEILGLDPDRYVPSADSFHALVHPEDRAMVIATDTRADLPRDHDLRFRVVLADGSVRVLHDIAAMSVDERGHRVSYGTTQDITEQHAVEQALRDSEDRLQQVIAATQDGWWDVDLRTGKAFHSARWCEIHGYQAGELAGDVSTWRALLTEQELARADALVAEAVAARAPTFTIDTWERHRDGHLVPVRVRGRIVYDDDGTPVRMSGMTSDLTEVRHAELAKEQFVSVISHELRTPLTAIAGTLELIAAGRSGPVTPATLALLEVAVRNTTRLRRLIDDLLDVEKLRSGTLPVQREPLDLAALVAETLEDHRILGQPRGITLDLEAGEPGAAMVVGDRRRLGQVVTNLVSNAVKHSPDAAVVQVRVHVDTDHVRVEVADTGDGVPDSFATRVFERFAQADPSDSRVRGGTGLGLAISRELILQHDGAIGYDTGGEATVFWFTLPRA